MNNFMEIAFNVTDFQSLQDIHYAFYCIRFATRIISIVVHTTGIYVVHSLKSKKNQHTILLHLSLVSILFTMIFGSCYVQLHSSRHFTRYTIQGRPSTKNIQSKQRSNNSNQIAVSPHSLLVKLGSFNSHFETLKIH